jgi:histidine triad (HIT) family protein
MGVIYMCVFCKIINHEIPSYQLYEDDSYVAFLDISQASIGHTLVVPKKHVNNLVEADEQTICGLFNLVAKLGKKISKNLNLKGFNVLCNNGEVAGQSIHHLHVHIIPRYENDTIMMKFSENHLSDSEMQVILERINQ